MGYQQSKPLPLRGSEAEKLLSERLQKLRLNDANRDVDEKVRSWNLAIDMDRALGIGGGGSGLEIEVLSQWEREVLADGKNRLALSALSSADPRTVLTSQKPSIVDQQIFNVKIPFEGAPITNQRSSGRCWLFASTNVFRVFIMKRYNLESFELSQAYLFFYDKLEKSNYFLTQILSTLDRPLDGRLLQTLLSQPVSDGGQWDMVFNLVKKYGLVPQVLYPDSFNAQNSGTINSLITTKLREDALALRALASNPGITAEALSSAKEKMVREIHLILTLTLGPPPSPTQPFKWQYLDASGAAKETTQTPLDFASDLSSSISIKKIGCDINSMFSLVNDPRHEPLTHLTVERLNNIAGPSARPITYVNVTMDAMKEACIKMLRAGLPIFFGSDVGKFSNSRSGIMDTELIDYELGFNVRLGMSKKRRLDVGESAMTHAMVLTAVHLERDEEGKDKSVRWRVQNSWGDAAGDKGWFVMTDKWMDEWVYQAVVEKRFVSKEVLDVLEKEPIVLPLWDPMGALA